MRNADAKKKMWTAGQLEEETYNALMGLAAQEGVPPAMIVEKAVEEYIRNVGKNSKNSFVYAAYAVLEMRSREVRLLNIKQIAVAHIENPTDESADQLRALCEMSGVSMEEIISDMNRTPHIKALIAEVGTLSSVEAWLLRFMEPGKSYAAKIVQEAAQKSGHSDFMIKKAKSKLNIVSRRMGKQWFWELNVVDTESSEAE
jgi:hypothetical protein